MEVALGRSRSEKNVISVLDVFTLRYLSHAVHEQNYAINNWRCMKELTEGQWC